MKPEWLAHDEKVKPYLWKHRRLAIAKNILGLLFAGWVVFTGRGINLEWELNTHIQNRFLLWLAFFGILTLVWKIITWPIGRAHHQIERNFHLSKQGFGSWVWDDVKGFLVGWVIGAIALGVIYGCVAYAGNNWWIPCGGLLILFSIIIAQLAPLILIPLFFKLKPMDSGPLKDRLLKLCDRFQIKVKDVYHLGLGQKTEKGNAAFLGFGNMKRIVIGDTLYEKFPPEEVEAVFAHELGHQVNLDMWKGIALGAVTLYLGFFLAQWLVSDNLFRMFSTGFDRPFGMLLFLFALSVVQLPLGIIQAAFSRWRERAADRFANEKIGNAKALGSALERLTYQNFGQFRPNAILEFLNHSHPAPWRRILNLEAMK